MDNQLRELPNGLGQCPTISTMLLQRNKMLEEIPEQFLLAFMSLRILDLSECESMKSLPPCLDQLVDLRAVHLDHCINLETLPPVGGLAKLQVLVCSGTGISTLPKFIGDLSTQFEKLLSNERLIDLFIGVNSSSCILETTDALLNGIKKLKNLELFISPSNTSTISIGGHSLKQVHLEKMHLLGQRMEWLFASMHAIIFSRCNGLGTMFEKLVANSDEIGCFDTVEIFHIFGCPDWVGVGSTKILSLENLLAVFVNQCEQVEELFKFDQNSGLDSVFPNLKSITLRGCPRLRFLSELNIAFPHLEEVVVEDCPLLKKLPLTLQNVGTIKEIRGERKWWDELEWENDDIKNLYTPVLCLY
ncbi:UNVERIFIED_CONTAM: hypothetical protein Scaly_0212900 [Sesamum calycinum]|uniref:Uncharacterized protein n=1 Tax=Sesamum calycinum TaxID=2727403 RepID=A0AAW2SZ47_9LAMI